MVDAGEELVCSSCGSVAVKEVIELPQETAKAPEAADYTSHALGSYLGRLGRGLDDTFSKGFSATPSTYRYLKTISDYSYKDGAGVFNCARLIERVCDRLAIPRTVVGESVSIARSVIGMREEHGEITIAAVSAFSMINACKRLRVTSVGVKEIIEAHRDLGYRVKGSVINELALDSTVRTLPRRAEEYVGNVIVHLRRSLGAAEEEKAPLGYFNELHEAARISLECVDGPSRGGHNPRALAATAVYAGEVALATGSGRAKRVSQRQIAKSVGLAEYTVREQFVELFRPRMGAIRSAITSQTSPRPGGPLGTVPLGPRAPRASW
jgi:transcription initiation factor TFIIIB Brf1 subunit/transcription initiation factor TFIIB